jgi:hypothetical protein
MRSRSVARPDAVQYREAEGVACNIAGGLSGIWKSRRRSNTCRNLVLVVIVLALIYTAFVVDPEAAADSLKQNGAVVPGIPPGEATVDHLDRVVSYTIFAGAPYLVAVLLIRRH